MSDHWDDMHAAGWEYHRNGVSGLGFWVRIVGGDTHIQWLAADNSGDDPTTPDARGDVILPRQLVEQLNTRRTVMETAVNHGIRGDNRVSAIDTVLADRDAIVAFTHHERGWGLGKLRMLVVFSGAHQADDRAWAAFRIADLLEGDAAKPAWRGDNLGGYVRPYLLRHGWTESACGVV